MMNNEQWDGDMHSLVGLPVSPGLARGIAYVYQDIVYRNTEYLLSEDANVEEEQQRIRKALEDVHQGLMIDMQGIESELGRTSAGIFRAQDLMLSSSSVVQELERTVETKRINAEQAVRIVFKLLAGKFRSMSTEQFRSRGDDIEDLSRRLLLSLAGLHAHSLETLPPNTVLVARQLLPSDTVFLSRRSTVAVLAEFAGRAAHAALLAREMGLPCVGSIPDLLEVVRTGDTVLVDGTRGEAIINPDDRTLELFEARLEAESAGKTGSSGQARRTAVTPSGLSVAVAANVRGREDVELAVEEGADGIGLFRTEPFFLSAKHLPGSRDLAEFLFESLRAARGLPVNIRLLDLGADKNPVYLHLPEPRDPTLGLRGIRVLLKYPELLDAQLGAMLEVSREIPLGILVPMVTIDADLQLVAERLQTLAERAGIRDLPRLGAMIETPAAALSIGILRWYARFFSIGTNDLAQYVMAASREDPHVTSYYLDDHPAVFRLVEMVLRESGDYPVSVCGELAGRTDALPRLIQAGIRSLSVPSSMVSEVKEAIRNLSPEK